MTEDLTTQSYWDGRWQAKRRSKLRQVISPIDSEYRRFLTFAFKNVPQGGCLLELGGAPGNMVFRQHSVRPDLTFDCVDFSPVGVKAAKLEYERAGINGTVYQADFRDWSIGENRYDIVTSFGLVEHFENYESAIHQHFRFCKPGGYVVITVPNYRSFPVRNLLRHYSKEILRTHNLDCMSSNALASAAKNFSNEITTGGFGSSVLPYSKHDRSIGGFIYRLCAFSWNVAIGLTTLLLFRKVQIRVWPDKIFLIAKSPVR
jgi:ubiquinone/menaquinone biosynthesis C-methylase UbiE